MGDGSENKSRSLRLRRPTGFYDPRQLRSSLGSKTRASRKGCYEKETCRFPKPSIYVERQEPPNSRCKQWPLSRQKWTFTRFAEQRRHPRRRQHPTTRQRREASCRASTVGKSTHPGVAKLSDRHVHTAKS